MHDLMQNGRKVGSTLLAIACMVLGVYAVFFTHPWLSYLDAQVCIIGGVIVFALGLAELVEQLR